MNTRRWMVRLSACAAALALAGCAVDDNYRRWADNDVQTILHDRKDKALGYQPDTTINAPKGQASIQPSAFEKIPQTPIPPAQPSPIEPSRVIVPYAAMGPETKWMKDWPEIEADIDIGLEAAQKRAFEKAKLGPPSPFIRQRRADLFSALQYGIENARQYQDQLETLYLAALDVTLQRHLLLEPQPFANSSLTYAGGQGDVATRSALTAANTLGVKQPLPYGGAITAQALVAFVDALNNQSLNGESAALALNGTIPILRGAGWVNLEPLVLSERTLVYRVRQFEDFRRQFVVDIASRYFRLQAILQSVRNRQTNYVNNVAILEQTQALFAANRISFLEVQRSRQSVLQAQTSLLTARANYEATVDDFKVFIGMPVDDELEIVPVTLEVAVPHEESTEAIALAEKYRLDLQTARDQIDDAHRAVGVAQNGLLPDLNLVGSVSGGNRADSPAKTLDSRTIAYSGGVSLDWPLDRLAERNAYRSALVALSSAQRFLQTQSESIKSDVRDSIRQIHTAELNVQIQKRAVDLAKRRLEYSTELLKLGQVSSSRDLVEAQTSLLSAQDSYEQARSDLQVNVLNYLRTTGTLRVDPHAGALGVALNLREADTNKAASGE